MAPPGWWLPGAACWVSCWWLLGVLLMAGVTVVQPLSLPADSCGIPACRFTGGCRESTAVWCDYQHHPNQTIRIAMESFPETMRTVNLVNIHTIEAQKDFLYSRESLESITFRNIRNLLLLEDSLVRGPHHPALSVTIDNVVNLEIHSNAINSWGHDSELIVKNVKVSTVKWSAFSSTSTLRKVLFENISSLNFGGGAFKANVSHLIIKDSTLPTCSFNTFGGHIENLLLHSANVSEVGEECLKAHSMNSLVVRSCRLPQIKSKAFSTPINSVVIESASIGVVETEAFQLSVDTLSIKASTFQDIASDALNVTATRYILLDGNNVTKLRENGFRGLQIGHSEAAINITKLSIHQAENGSLQFVNGANVAVQKLTLHVDCMCNVGQLLQQLVRGPEAAPSHNRTEGELRLQGLIRDISCSLDNVTLATSEFIEQHCREEGGSTTSPGSAGSEEQGTTADQQPDKSSEENTVSPLFALVAVPVLLVVVMVVLVKRRWAGASQDFPGEAKTGAVHVENAATEEPPLTKKPADDGEDDQTYCEILVSADNSGEDKTVMSISLTAYEDLQFGQPSVENEYESVYEDVTAEKFATMSTEVAGQKTQPSVSMKTLRQNPLQGEETSEQNSMDAVQAVYAKVVKKKSKENAEGTDNNSKSTGPFPLYASVVKGKTDDNMAQVATANGTQGGSIHGSEDHADNPSGASAETLHDVDTTNKDMPAYAVVSKGERTTSRSLEEHRKVLHIKGSPPVHVEQECALNNENKQKTSSTVVEDERGSATYAVVVKCRKNKRSEDDECLTRPNLSYNPTSSAASNDDAAFKTENCQETAPTEALYSEIDSTTGDSVRWDWESQQVDELVDNPLYESMPGASPTDRR